MRIADRRRLAAGLVSIPVALTQGEIFYPLPAAERSLKNELPEQAGCAR
jgi:hypothetical protein